MVQRSEKENQDDIVTDCDFSCERENIPEGREGNK